MLDSTLPAGSGLRQERRTPYAQLGDPCIINNVFGAEWIASNCGAGLYCDDSQQPSRCVSAGHGGWSTV
jgi:hypothetical protein